MLGLSAGNGNVCPSGRERGRDAKANTGTSAGNDCNLPCE
jgi:hypothetical protein